MAFARASSIEVESYRDMKGSHSTFLYYFQFKTCFFRSFTHNSPAKQLTFHHVPQKQRSSSIRTYPIIAQDEHKAIFHVCELYSTNQITFCQIRLRSIKCHFLSNNLHVITYSNRIANPTKNDSYGTKCH